MLTREARRSLDKYKPEFEGVCSAKEFTSVWNKHSNAIIGELKPHVKPLPAVLREAKKYLKPNLSSPAKVAKRSSQMRVEGFFRWANSQSGDTESLLNKYEEKTKVAFTVSELETIVSRLDKIAGIPKTEWTYLKEANAFTLDHNTAPDLKTGIRRGEGGKLWNIALRDIDGEKLYFASIVPERNTVIASKETQKTNKTTKVAEVDRKEFSEGWKYASKGNEVPQFKVTGSFLEGYVAFNETELEKTADTHETLDQPLQGRDDIQDDPKDTDTTDEKDNAYKNRADDLNSKGNDDILEQGFEQDK